MKTKKHSLWFEMILSIIIPVLGMAMGVGVILLLGLNGTDYGNLLINFFFLAGVIVLIRLFKYSSEELGLKIIEEQMQKHVVLSLLVFVLYMLLDKFAQSIPKTRFNKLIQWMYSIRCCKSSCF